MVFMLPKMPYERGTSSLILLSAGGLGKPLLTGKFSRSESTHELRVGL